MMKPKGTRNQKEIQMKKFIDLQEKPVITFNRFNPPTIGHEKLCDKLNSVQILVIIKFMISQSQNPKKDPLQYVKKITSYMRQSFPKHKKI